MRDLTEKAARIERASHAMDGADLRDVALALLQEAYREGHRDGRREGVEREKERAACEPGGMVSIPGRFFEGVNHG